MSSLKSVLIFTFSILVYFFSLGIFLVFALFLLNIGASTVSSDQLLQITPESVLVNLGLILFFGISHSLLARPWVKKFLRNSYPRTLIRPIYLLVSIISLGLLILWWKPFGPVLYDVRGTPIGTGLIILYVLGWVVEVMSSFQINHFKLFGLSQTYHDLTDTKMNTQFQVPLFYQYVRHPIYSGWLMVFWITPYMTLSHLFFAITLTIYIRVATYFEERDLVDYFGKEYRKYMNEVPYRYIPGVV